VLIYLTKHRTKLKSETTLVSDQMSQIFDLTPRHMEGKISFQLFPLLWNDWNSHFLFI